jgi:hypothetical protein
MKKTFGGWRICVLLAAPALLARAGNPPVPAVSAPSSSSALVPPPAAPVSPAPAPVDGVNFSTMDPEQIANQTMEIQAEQKQNADSTPSWEAERQQQARAHDQDWMLRDYEERLKKEGLSQPSDAATLPSSDSQTTATNDDDSLLNPPDQGRQAAPTSANNDAAQLPDETKLIQLKSLSSLQPLLPPLSSPAASAPHGMWDSMRLVDATALRADPAPHPSAAANENNDESSILDIPGLTAAKSGMGPAATDLNFQEPLPDDSADTAQARIAERNNFMVPTTPTSDVSEFFKKQAEALQPPAAPNVVQPLTVPARPVRPVSPEPTAKPEVSGLRTHVADPFDYLNQ